MDNKPASRGRPNPVMAAGLSDEARKAITASFEALQEWRHEVAASTDRYTNNVFDKMSTAARAMGWPDNLVEASHAQMKQISNLQVHMIDQIMEAWQQQVKSPGAMPSVPSAFPGAGSMGFPGSAGLNGLPGMSGMSGLPLAPIQFWMQAAEMWQKSWSSAMSQWIDMQKGLASGAMRDDKRR